MGRSSRLESIVTRMVVISLFIVSRTCLQAIRRPGLLVGSYGGRTGGGVSTDPSDYTTANHRKTMVPCLFAIFSQSSPQFSSMSVAEH